MTSSEEEEEEEEGDAFNQAAFDVPAHGLERHMSDDGSMSPNRSLASMRGTQSKIGTSSSIQDRIVLALPRNSARRGSVVQVGGRSTALSQGAELAVMLRRLKVANETGDANVMQAALTAAGAAAMMSGPEAEELQMLAMAMASRLAEDTGMAKTSLLRRSSEVRGRVRRLWDLMVAETTAMRRESHQLRPGEAASDVALDAYRSMHMRIAKVFAVRGEFDEEEATRMADQDWAEDISRFSGTSHITVWLDEIRTKFREASARAVAEHSFRELFATFDEDGNGELDKKEFRKAVREKMEIDEETISPEEVEALFDAVDADGSGELDSSEFMAWLFPPVAREKGKKAKKPKGKNALIRAQSEAALKSRFRDASERMSQSIGWLLIFEQYDDDNSGELELDEFTKAVREECQLTEDAVPDYEIEELFGVIDADQSGAIDSEELGDLLNADLSAGSMTFGPFYSSIFELASVWVPVEEERSYVMFLDGVFGAITQAINGHEMDLQTDTLPVFDDEDNAVPNFKLKLLEKCLSLVSEDGSLKIDNLESVNAQDILPENNPMSPAYIAEKQAKGRERRSSLSAAISASSLSSPRARAGSNAELALPSPMEEVLPVIKAAEEEEEDDEENEEGGEPEPEPEPEIPPPASPEQLPEPAAAFTCVNTCDIRDEAELGSTVVGRLEIGAEVQVIETQRSSGGVLQLRFENGWVSVHDESSTVCLERIDPSTRRLDGTAKKKFRPRPPPENQLQKLAGMRCLSQDLVPPDRHGEGGWRKLSSPKPEKPKGTQRLTSKDFIDVQSKRDQIASHWTYGAGAPMARLPTGVIVAKVSPRVQAKRLPAVHTTMHTSAAGALSARGPAPPGMSFAGGTGSLMGKGKAKNARPVVQIDAIVGTGPHSGRGLLRQSGGGMGSARLISPRTPGAAGFRFATSKRGLLENEFDVNSFNKVASRTAAGGSWKSPFERIGGRMAPDTTMAPNRPHTGHTITRRAPPMATLLRPAAVPVEVGTARAVFPGCGSDPLYLHLMPGEKLSTPRSSRRHGRGGLAGGPASTRHHGASLATTPGRAHRVPGLDLPTLAVDERKLPALSVPKPAAWGRLPPGEAMT